jgi:hypothetical protein
LPSQTKASSPLRSCRFSNPQPATPLPRHSTPPRSRKYPANTPPLPRRYLPLSRFSRGPCPHLPRPISRPHPVQIPPPSCQYPATILPPSYHYPTTIPPLFHHYPAPIQPLSCSQHRSHDNNIPRLSRQHSNQHTATISPLSHHYLTIIPTLPLPYPSLSRPFPNNIPPRSPKDPAQIPQLPCHYLAHIPTLLPPSCRYNPASIPIICARTPQVQSPLNLCPERMKPQGFRKGLTACAASPRVQHFQRKSNLIARSRTRGRRA